MFHHLPFAMSLQVLAPFNKEINVNGKVKDLYVEHLLPKMASAGDDNNYGSSAMYDVLALQVCDLGQTVSRIK